jgi:hypothetical protein
VGTVADDLVRPRHRHVEHRRAIDGDADRLQIGRHQAGVEARGFAARIEIEALRHVGEDTRRGAARPVGRAEPGDAAALLIDQDGRLGPADAVAQLVGQPADLIRRSAVAGEQDEPGGFGLGEEFPFFIAEFGPGATEDYCATCHGVTAGRRDS